jgi:acetolactate synthase-1/2/3 large subunit
MGRSDVVLVDTGATKMWMARLYPTYQRNTCLISNGLSTMGFALPGALGVKLAHPDSKVLAVVGAGSFLMNSQEIETAVRARIPLVGLIWEDGCPHRMENGLELGAHYREVRQPGCGEIRNLAPRAIGSPRPRNCCRR